MQTRICKHCNKEKNLSNFYCLNKYIYTTCIKCTNYRRKIDREVKIKRENEKKQKEQEKKLLLKNKNLKGPYKLYHDYFCKKIKYYNGINFRLSEKYALQDLKNRFKLTPKFANSLLENQFKGKGVLDINYEKNFIRSKI
jgi:hypothetical protein